MKIEGSGSASISQRHGSADPHQNAMDPQHWMIQRDTDGKTVGVRSQEGHKGQEDEG